ncbi:hypothetical protein [Subtercola boreus]|uniref:hypothetical protein n=1 Tax=Subtercola boreus TaxID=120213 RepID=UPI0011C05A87|nr:hypothetical protein [Subtercola boreus]
MDSSLDVQGVTGGSAASGAERDPLSVEPAVSGTRGARLWFGRHAVSLGWFVPLIVLGTAVHAAALTSRAAPGELPGAVAAVVFGTLAALLLWMLARRLHLTQPAAALAVFVFLLSPLALTAHTTASLPNAVAPVLLAGVIVVIDPRRSTRLRMIVGAIVAAILAVVLLLELAASGAPATSSVIGRWWALDPAILILGTGCSVAALAVARLRPFGLVSLGLVLLALRPGADMLVPAAALWLPLAALLVAGTVQAAAQAAWEAGFTAVWLEIVAGIFLVAVVGVFIFAAPALAPGYRTLLEGSPGGQPGQPGAVPTFAQSGVVGDAAAGATPPASAGAEVPGTDDPTGPAAEAESGRALAGAQTAARASIGLQLSTNPQLQLSAEATAELVAGDVDVRSVLTLAQLLASTPVAVSDFPAVAGEVGAPRRQILISSLGGRASTGSSAVLNDVSAYFENLAPPLGGANVVSTDDGVLVIFPFGEPADLLPAGQGP